MKTLTLFRHAKSSWKYPLTDISRPLSGRGLRQATDMANLFKFGQPDIIFTSHAHRATSTALIYKNTIGIQDQNFHLAKQLYELNTVQLTDWIKRFSEEYTDVWCFSHNPTCNDLAAFLLGYEIDNIVTSGFVRIQLKCQSWSDLELGCGELIELNSRTYLGDVK